MALPWTGPQEIDEEFVRDETAESVRGRAAAAGGGWEEQESAMMMMMIDDRKREISDQTRQIEMRRKRQDRRDVCSGRGGEEDAGWL